MNCPARPRKLPHTWRANRPKWIARSDDIQFAGNCRAINSGRTATQQFLLWVRVARDDQVQLGLAGAKVLANDLAEDRTIIHRALQVILRAAGKHCAAGSSVPVDGVAVVDLGVR